MISSRLHNSGGFSRIELMMIIFVAGIVLAIFTASAFITTRYRQVKTARADIAAIDKAVAQYAIDTQRERGFQPVFEDLKKYLSDPRLANSSGLNRFGEPVGPLVVGSSPLISLRVRDYYSDIADDAYWAPYQPITLIKPPLTAGPESR